MTDFHPLVARLMAVRPSQTPDVRALTYDQIRLVLIKTLKAGHVQATDEEVAFQVRQLEDAIQRLEATYAEDDLARGGHRVETAPQTLTEQLSGERRRFALNAAAGGATNVVKILLQLLLLPVMAHLLGPAEFGLYALALPTIAFLTTLADGGLGASLAREQESSRLVWSTAFWTLLVTCSAMALFAVVGGAITAWVVKQPRLFPIMGVLSLNLPLLALTALPAARLIRRGNLIVHSIADLASALIGALVAVGLALSGAGAWALAFQYVASGVTSCLIFNLAAFQRPAFEFQLSSLRSHLALGGTVIGSRLSELFGRQLESLLLGRIFGPAFLGAFTLANQTSRFMCESVGNPVWGALYSHAVRASLEDAERLHERLSRLMALLLFPLSALASSAAPQIFNIILGPNWASAGSILQIVLPSYALQAVASQCGALLLANGRGTILLAIFATLSVLRIAGLLVIAATGSTGVAWGIACANLAFGMMMMAAIGQSSRLRVKRLTVDLLPIGIASTLSGLSCASILYTQPQSVLWTAVSLAGGCTTFMAAIILLQGRRLVADVMSLRRLAQRS